VYTFREIFTSRNLIFVDDCAPTLLFTPVFIFVARLLVPRCHCRYTILALCTTCFSMPKLRILYTYSLVSYNSRNRPQLLPQTTESEGNTACCLWVSDRIYSCTV